MYRQENTGLFMKAEGVNSERKNKVKRKTIKKNEEKKLYKKKCCWYKVFLFFFLLMQYDVFYIPG